MTQNPDLTTLPRLRLQKASTPINPTQMSRQHLPIQASRRRQEQLLSTRRQKGQIQLALSSKIDDAKRFTSSVIANGANDVNYAQAANIFLWNDIIPPPKARSTRRRGPVVPNHNPTSQELEEIPRGNSARFDYRVQWLLDHRRGAKECIFVFVDCQTNKIVDYEMIQETKF
jgi:hypothetical protein